MDFLSLDCPAQTQDVLEYWNAPQGPLFPHSLVFLLDSCRTIKDLHSPYPGTSHHRALCEKPAGAGARSARFRLDPQLGSPSEGCAGDVGLELQILVQALFCQLCGHEQAPEALWVPGLHL